MKINTMNDLTRFVADQPIDTNEYVDGYESQVAHELLDIMRDKGFSWGADIPELSDKEFWNCFVSSEKINLKVELNGKLVHYDACVNMMDDEIRDDLHNDYAGSITEQEFLDAYVERHMAKFDEEFSI